MQQENCSVLWDPQQKMLDGRLWSICNVGLPVCSVEQTEDTAMACKLWFSYLQNLSLNDWRFALVSVTGFDEYRGMYDCHPNILLCFHYVCDIGRIIVSGTAAAAQQPTTCNVNLILIDCHCESSIFDA